MKRKNIDNMLYIDFDKLVACRIEPYNILKENRSVLQAYRVVGISDTGLSFELFKDEASEKIDMCVNWIVQNWVK